MLSILIPVYNEDVTELVSSLHEQAEQLGINYEIICADDSGQLSNPLPELTPLRWITNPMNLGRAKCRNKLTHQAQGEFLLFLDADMHLCSANFIANYWQARDEAPVSCGGILYENKKPPLSQRLRWNYGKKYEARAAVDRNEEPYGSFMTGNYFIRKDVAVEHLFDESITTYGHEDTLLGKSLLESAVQIKHLDNGAIHGGLESNEQFILKTQEGLQGLWSLYQKGKINRNYSKVIRLHENFSQLGILPLVLWFIANLEPLFRRKVESEGKHIWFFQLLKLKWFSAIAQQTT